MEIWKNFQKIALFWIADYELVYGVKPESILNSYVLNSRSFGWRGKEG